MTADDFSLKNDCICRRTVVAKRQVAFRRVNQCLIAQSNTLLDRTPSESSDAQCGRFDATSSKLASALEIAP